MFMAMDERKLARFCSSEDSSLPSFEISIGG